MLKFGIRHLGGLVIDCVVWMYRCTRAAAYADVEGRYYAYKSNPIDIVEEPDGARWLSLDDVRRTVTGLPRYRLLLAIYPLGLRTDGRWPRRRIEARTLCTVLLKAQHAGTIRFLRWLEREVILPADNRAARSAADAAYAAPPPNRGDTPTPPPT